MKSTRASFIGAVVAVLLAAFDDPAQADHQLVEQVSTGPAGGNAAIDVEQNAYPSADGSRILFLTRDALDTTDTDAAVDIYQREAGSTTLVSAGGNGPYNVTFRGASDDGSRVFFETPESLTGTDADFSIDVYERSGGVTTLVSGGGNGAFDARFKAATPDGTHVVFSTAEQLAATDADTFQDLYERVGGVTQQVSVGVPNNFDFVGQTLISADGSRVTFEQEGNVWQRAGGVTTRITTQRENPYFCSCPGVPRLGGTSEDGSQVFFVSRGNYTAGADDYCGEDAGEIQETCYDVFRWTASSGAFELISNGPGNFSGFESYMDYHGASAGGSRVFFGTDEQQSPDDHDPGIWDTYENFGGQLKLISTGPAEQNDAGDSDPVPAFVSRDGLTVAFGPVSNSWVGADTDTARDAYVYSHGVMHLASIANNGANGPTDAYFKGASEDGSRIFFVTGDQLAPEDTDTTQDIYERIHDSATEMLATGPQPSFFAGSSRDGTAVVLMTGDRLLPSDTDSSQDLYLFRAPSGHIRPKAGSPFVASLVPAYQACASPNRTHGPSLAFCSCSPPARTSTRLTVGTSDANGQPAKSIGSAQLFVRIGDPSTAADEADVDLYSDVTDVRKATDLSDYTGELELRFGLRITDKLNGTPGSGTVTDMTLPAAVPCAATADATIGGHCSLFTSVDALIPGAVAERSRAVWALDQVRVNDGGPDGSAATQDNDLFAVEGLFVP